MRIVLVSLIGLLAFADDADWARRLASDDAAEREKAVADLESLGDDAAPIARRLLDAGDPEVAARAQEVLAWLDYTAAARRLLGVLGRFSIEVPQDHPKPLGEVLRELGPRFGVQVEVPQKVSDLPWSGAFHDLKLLQALDRICGDVGVPYALAPGRVEVFEGKAASPPPRDYPGPFRVRVRGAGFQSGSDATQGRSWSLVTITLDAVHEACLLEVPPSAIEVDVAEYDTGDLLDVGALRRAERHPWRGRDGGAEVRLPEPPAGAKAVRSLRGRLVLDAPTTYDTWTFDEVVKGAEVKGDRGQATILAVERYKDREAECIAAYVRITGEAFGQDRIGGAQVAGRVSLLATDGSAVPNVPWWPDHHAWTGYYHTVECEARFVFPSEAAPSRLVVSLPRTFESVEFPFEIRDILFRP